MSRATTFSPDYLTARRRFREGVKRLGWMLEVYSIGALGPRGEGLTIDVGLSPPADSDRALVVSSGLHGVEGFLGSAVQCALLEGWSAAQKWPSNVRVVLLHGMNPYGFAWLRRCDHNNVDLNRNFLLQDESYRGSPPGYARLDPVLNPRTPPSRWGIFGLTAALIIARYPMPALWRAVPSGQCDFPKGLFFGGNGPSRTKQTVEDHLESWFHGSRLVTHLDFHTGLGRSGVCQLLIDSPLSADQRSRLHQWFGSGAVGESGSSGLVYDARGTFGQWCVARNRERDYLFLCVEFGTYGLLQVLAGLRAENRAHHWGHPEEPATTLAKQRLKELFCPASQAWRSRSLGQGLGLVQRAIDGTAGTAICPATGCAIQIRQHQMEREKCR